MALTAHLSRPNLPPAQLTAAATKAIRPDNVAGYLREFVSIRFVPDEAEVVLHRVS